jgi:hypothetical protein
MPDRLSRARVAALATLLAGVAWLPGAAANWLGEPRPGSGPHLVYLTRPSTPLPDEYLAEPLPLRRLQPVPHEVDLRGNEIVRPVERYSIDDRGALYELHSPETELPQLAPPEL